MSSDKISNVGKYYDDVRKYSIIRNATESLKMDTSFIYDEDDDEKLEHFNQLTSIEVLNEINNKFMDFKSKWKNVFGDNYSFRAGEGMSGCGSLHIVAMFDPITGELLETYISKGSTGGCQSNLAAVSRLISLSARAGVDVYTIADQLKSCPACPSYVGRTMTKHDTSKGKCCPDAIANALIDMYKEMKNSIFSDDIETSNVKSKVIKKNTEDKEQSVNVKNPCPVCGEELTFEGGCNVCKACGWSKCD